MNLLYFMPWLAGVLLIVSVGFAVLSFKRQHLFRIAQYVYYAATGVVGVMLLSLLAGFIGHQFQFSYIYHYSSLDLSLAYRMAAVWAGQEGSFVLWTFLLMVSGIVALKNEDVYHNSFLTLLGLVSLVFMIHCVNNNAFLYIWETSTDYAQGVVPPDGAGLNPLLQDFWMMSHPPVLFIGYALATIPFMYGIIALLYNNYSLLIRSYRWVVGTVVALGIGIFLGGYWAYKVLGWGGYWGWDPVENASLIPWLISIALMHGLIVQKRKGALVRFNILMASATFVFVLMCTYLTRSGILADFSVHSFSGAGKFNDLAVFMATVVVLTIGLIVYRYKESSGKPLDNKALSRDNIILYGIAVLLFFGLFVFIGTCMPIVTGLLNQVLTVGAPYYNSIAKPVAFVIAALLLIVPFVKPPQILRAVIIGAAAVIVTVLVYIGQDVSPAPFILMVLGFAMILAHIKGLFPNTALNLAARTAHVGVAIFIIGAITSNTQSKSYHAELPMNEKKTISSVTLELTGKTCGDRSAINFNYTYSGDAKAISTPYFIIKRTNQLFREPYIDYNLHYDVYVSPVEYIRGQNKMTQIMVKKGEPGTLNDVTVTFQGFDIDHDAMMKGNATVYARLAVDYKGKRYIVRPSATFEENIRKNNKAFIPTTQRAITMLDFDVRESIIFLQIDAPAHAPVPADSVIVDVSFKRLIWLVWLGTVVLAIGTAIPLFQRKRP